MPPDSPQIIADAHGGADTRRGFLAILAVTAAVGIAAALYYATVQLTLSHYDARAHLVVARRILDSLTPGWVQIGAVWLPLPHLINAVPVQWDWAYRTGSVATAVSVLAMSAGLASLGALIARRTGSTVAGLASALVILLNPNVLYLQSTPMTEPLLFGLSLLSLAAIDAWVAAPSARRRRAAGWLVVALMLTRYEGWFIGSGLVVLAALAHWRQGRPALTTLGLVPYPVGAVLSFLVLSKATVGSWFVTGGFYEATNPSMGRPLAALLEVLGSTVELGGVPLVLAGGLGAVACLAEARRRPAAALPLALLFAAALPLIAFHSGHPHRVRYMIPVVVAAGALAGLAAARLPRSWRGPAAVALLLVTVWTRPPLDPQAAMLLEAQWETPYRIGRQAVTAHLERTWDGTPILASMGSLAHYMQETSSIGLGIADYVHEGNGMLWQAAREAPARHVRWVLIEERAEGGDQLFQRAQADPSYLDGFSRVAEGGGVALYERRATRPPLSEPDHEAEVEGTAAQVDLVIQESGVETARVP